MATLSPFRYIQLCRYIIQRFITDHPTPALWKGKGRQAQQQQQSPTHTRRITPTRLAFATAAMEHGRQGDSFGDDGPIAGPSRNPLPHNPHSDNRPLGPDPDLPPEPSEIYRLMNDERLLVQGGVKPPREVIVLCHGLYGFSTATPIPLFPSLKLHYWASVLEVLRDRMGCNVVVVGVKGTGSIKERAEQMDKYLKDTLPKGSGVNFVAHSMGGLDVRHLISNLKPTHYTPISLTTIGTPHRGSPFMDWCAANIGVGTTANKAAVLEATKMLPYSLKSPLLARTEEAALAGFSSAMSRYLLNIFDSPAYSNLTTSFLREFNPETPDDPRVKYISVAGRTTKISVLHPLWFPKLVLDAAAEKGYTADDSGDKYEGNDGLVSVKSAKWGEYIGAVDDTHHWDLRGEGGLWPSGLGTDDKKESTKNKDKNATENKSSGELIMPGGWDWEDGLEEYLGLNLDTVKSATGIGQSDSSSDKKPVKVETKEEKKTREGFQIAQVGQLLDWVTDVVPGSKVTESGKKQVQEAQDRHDNPDSAPKKDEKRKKEKEKDKFDLAKFYGGLMLKLREDGY